MAVEIEAKLKVEDLSVIRQRLQNTGAQQLGEAMETNVFFDTEDRSLLAADEGLRLRQTLKATGEKEFVITFKGPRMQGNLKSRKEVEVGVTDFANAAELIEVLGYHRVLSFEKKRETWRLDHCNVELDELPILGTFVEIEGPSESHVVKVQDKLALSDHKMIKPSYIAMLMTHLAEHGKSSRNVTFK